MATVRPDPAELQRQARELRPFIVDLTLRICRVRTVDYFVEDFPAGGPDGMASPGEEGKVVAILQPELDRLGIPHTSHAKVPGRENLLARVGRGVPGHRRLMVMLHTDVVPSGSPSAWRFAPFEPFEKDGKLYGRGVLDDKGPLASSFAALALLKRHEEHIPGEFVFAAVGDEEVGVGVGVDHLLEQGLIDCTDAIIPDIAGDMKEINVAEKGRVLLKVRAKGRQAHAMNPAKGINAIHAMARFLLALEESAALRHTPHAVLGGPTINTGLIRGGMAPNAVAADCETTLDIRYVPSQSAQAIREEIQALAGKVSMPGASFEVEIFQDALPCEVSPQAPIVQAILEHAPGARVVGSGGGTFAKPLVLAGVEAVGWAPGNEATYHEPNEEIEVEQLVVFAGRLAALALDVCSRKV
ncbi:MAG TPA: M20/M25/M40 family metallo-hydrolase [Candidatus Polarisedimenticolia bacterium]|nr:M20/M25/M40 family metallo-hydrolase [Candidatus Polarisedimenticolia bacterium]